MDASERLIDILQQLGACLSSREDTPHAWRPLGEALLACRRLGVWFALWRGAFGDALAGRTAGRGQARVDLLRAWHWDTVLMAPPRRAFWPPQPRDRAARRAGPSGRHLAPATMSGGALMRLAEVVASGLGRSAPEAPGGGDGAARRSCASRSPGSRSCLPSASWPPAWRTSCATRPAPSGRCAHPQRIPGSYRARVPRYYYRGGGHSQPDHHEFSISPGRCTSTWADARAQQYRRLCR